MKSAPLSPLGTAWQRFCRTTGRPVIDDALLRHARQLDPGDQDVDDEMLYLATELARWPRDLAAPARESLVAVLLQSMASVRQGSTRLPLAATSTRLPVE